jgi:Signal transduction histidine kinase involved in nitrogen fixation and metabolism regulation
MKLKGYFFILAAMLLLVFGWVFFENVSAVSWKAILTEALIFIVLIYLIFFYAKTVRPLRNISNGMDLLQEQDFSSRLRKVGQYEADKVVDIFNKMMGQLKNERLRLREQNQFLDLLVKASPMGVVVLNYDKEIADINPAAARMLEIGDRKLVIGKKVPELKNILRIDLSGIPPHETRTLSVNDGSVYKCTYESFVDHGFPRPFYLIESLTEEVRRAEKKAYEKVIRMISHEVNNTTAGITSTLDTIAEDLVEKPETGDMREAVRVCIDRCYNMSKFITGFADVVKIPKAHLVPTDLNIMIQSMMRFMEVMCHHRNIRLHFNPDNNLKPVLLDGSLFEQVLQNIIKNSVESIGRDGDIYISTDAKNKTLTIADTGKGIGKEVESKLFSPFFSTKPAGQGIGLLFIREVLVQHDCLFSLRTYSDGLTRFVIQFKN